MDNSELEKLKEQIKSLELEKNVQSIILENIPNSIYFKDTKGRYIKFSKSTLNKFGLMREEELSGASDSNFFREDYAKSIFEQESDINELLRRKQRGINRNIYNRPKRRGIHPLSAIYPPIFRAESFRRACPPCLPQAGSGGLNRKFSRLIKLMQAWALKKKKAPDKDLFYVKIS